MKQRLTKTIALFIVILVVAVACFPATLSAAAASNYATNGLVAMYQGSDHGTSATTWKDSSTKGNDITDIAVGETGSKFTDKGFLTKSLKVYFPQAVVDTINGQAFTVEVVFGDITSLGASWNTFVSSANDSFALFRLLNDDTVVLKSENGTAKNARPKSATGALETLKNSTLTITYKVGGKINMYIDGVKACDELDAITALNAADLFFGHDDVNRNYEAEFRAIRFYSVELTAAQVAANAAEDQKVCFTAGESTTSSTTAVSSEATNSSETAASSTAASSAAAESSKVASSSAKSTVSSAASSAEENGNNTLLYVGIGAAAVVIIVIIAIAATRKKK